MGYNLLKNGVYWGCHPFTNHLLTSWDIQATVLHPLDFLATSDVQFTEVVVWSGLIFWSLDTWRRNLMAATCWKEICGMRK